MARSVLWYRDSRYLDDFVRAAVACCAIYYNFWHRFIVVGKWTFHDFRGLTLIVAKLPASSLD